MKTIVQLEKEIKKLENEVEDNARLVRAHKQYTRMAIAKLEILELNLETANRTLNWMASL
jgi:hypothetical protein